MRSKCYLVFSVFFLMIVLTGCSSDKVVSPVDFYGPPPPNPLNLKVTHHTMPYPESDITFLLPYAGRVRLEVLNATGYKVRLLFDGDMGAGANTVQWDGTNEDGEQVKSGLFIYDLQAASFRSWKIMFWCADPDCLDMIKDRLPND